MLEIDLDNSTTIEKAKYLVNEHNTHIEYEYFDGEQFVYFEIIKIDTYTIDMIVQKDGRINVTEYEIFEDTNGEHYFEYINPYNRIYLNNFDIDENL